MRKCRCRRVASSRFRRAIAHRDPQDRRRRFPATFRHRKNREGRRPLKPGSNPGHATRPGDRLSSRDDLLTGSRPSRRSVNLEQQVQLE